jgi:hypothetical protein
MAHTVDDLLIGFGDALVRKDVITPEQLEEADMIVSEMPILRVGEVLLGLGYLRLSDYINHLREHLEGLRLGDYLVLRNIITWEQLQEALKAQAESGKMLGHCLIALGFCTLPGLQRALAEQRALRGQSDDDV